jgi:hypothetical protein
VTSNPSPFSGDHKVIEVTFVGENIEVYANINEDGKAIDVYWNRDKRRLFLTNNNDKDSSEVPYRQGQNPLFVHAVDPEEAFRIARRDFNLTESDEKQLVEIDML